MACLFTEGWSLADNCLDGIGGVKTFYIQNFSGSTSYTYDAEDIITGGSISNFFEIEQRREQGLFNQTRALSLETGANVYTQQAQMSFFKYQAASRNLAQIMGQTESSIIALLNEGTYVLIGEDIGVNALTDEGGSGQKFEDLNGIKVNFEGKSKLGAREMSATFFGTLNIL